MRTAFFSFFTFGLAALAPAAAGAADVSVKYNIDVGPMTVTEVSFSLDLSADAARAKARIRNAGMSRLFSEFDAKAEAEAKLGGDLPEPVSYRVKRENSDKRPETIVRWQGGQASFAPPIGNAERAARVAQALAGGVVDPVTAVLRMGLTGDNPCPSVHQVFDGREVFELQLTDKGKGKLDNDSWKGPVQRCEVRWTPVAGRAKDKNEPGDSYDVAFAPVSKLDSGRPLWLPVEMSGRIKGLGFKGYLTRLGGGD